MNTKKQIIMRAVLITGEVAEKLQGKFTYRHCEVIFGYGLFQKQLKYSDAKAHLVFSMNFLQGAVINTVFVKKEMASLKVGHGVSLLWAHWIKLET